MNAKPISTESLSYRLAHTYGRLTVYGGKTDICRFRGAMLWGLFNITWMVLFAMLLVYVLGFADLVAWVAYLVITWSYVPPSDNASALLFVMLVALVAAVAFVCVVFGLDRLSTHLMRKEPSALSLAYRSWREKACYPVQITKDQT